MLVIALCKGRFLDPSLDLLANAGIRFSDDVASSRKLIFESDDKRFRAVLVKPAGRPDLCGIRRRGHRHRRPRRRPGVTARMSCSRSDLKFGHCKIAVAGPKGSELRIAVRSDSPTVRVATKYPRITLELLQRPRDTRGNHSALGLDRIRAA